MLKASVSGTLALRKGNMIILVSRTRACGRNGRSTTTVFAGVLEQAIERSSPAPKLIERNRLSHDGVEPQKGINFSSVRALQE